MNATRSEFLCHNVSREGCNADDHPNAMGREADSRFPLRRRSGLWPNTRAPLGRSDVVLVDTGAVKMRMARLYPTYERNTCLMSNGRPRWRLPFPGALGVELARRRPSCWP